MTSRDQNLFFDQVEVDHFFRYTMLHLDPRIHFHEIKIAVLIHEELNRSNTFIIDGAGGFLGGLSHFVTEFVRHKRRR